uniref:Uncharacterized protein n=1 Tax=Zea mays TaxID=4577 RepID=B6SNM3_MAIZE|nr:hypothetical protein [Zea mays]|eukprot:NP_001142760.1 uncharacterized protein LOC100275113 [Zea mays]
MKAVPADSAAPPVPMPMPMPATKITIPVSAVGGTEAALLGKGRYKVWALAAIALLALWSMSAASVSLRWSSSGDLASVYGDLDVPLADDLDSLIFGRKSDSGS